MRITEAFIVAFLISGSVGYANSENGLAIGTNGEVLSSLGGYYHSTVAALKGTAVVEISSDISSLRPYNYKNKYNQNYEAAIGEENHKGDYYTNPEKGIKSVAIGDHSTAKDGGIALGSYAYAKHNDEHTVTGKTVHEYLNNTELLSYKANGANTTGTDKVSLTKGLNFVNGTNTTASIEKDGIVKYSLNDNVALSKDGSVTIGDNTSLKNGNATINKVIVNGNDGYITGLSNRTWEIGTTQAVDGRAATENQLKALETGLMDKGLRFSANSGNVVTNKLGSEVQVSGTGTKEDSKYSSENIKTKVSQDNTGKTTIEVMLDKNLKTESLIAGEKGKDGNPGVDGTVGANGKDGSAVVLNGKDGSIGLNGKDGKNGLSIKGDNGNSGVDGTPGTDGKTRIVYEYKNPHKPEETIKEEVATLNDGLKFTGNNGKENKQKLNTLVKVVGERNDGQKEYSETASAKNNIMVEADEKDTLTVKLAKDLKNITSISNSNDANGTTITLGDRQEADTKVKTVDVGGAKITNVAAGTQDTDAVNVSQLKEIKEKPLTFKGDTGEDITTKLGDTVNVKGEAHPANTLTTGNIGVETDKDSKTLIVKLAENIDLGENGQVAIGDSILTTDGLQIADGPSVTSVGINAGDMIVTGVDSGIRNIKGEKVKLSELTPEDLEVSGTNGVNVNDLREVSGNLTKELKTHYFSVNNPDEKDGNYNNDGASGKNAMAIGKNTGAMGEESVAVGTKAYAKGYKSVAFGESVVAEKHQGIAIGGEAYANAAYTIALGKNVTANKDSSTAIGSSSHANGNYSFVLGNISTADGDGSFVVGSNSHAQGRGATVFGDGNTAGGNSSFSSGRSNHANADSSVAQGISNVTDGTSSVASGISNVTKSNNAIAQGIYNVAEGSNSFATGYHNVASKERSMAMGIESNAHGNGAIAVGRKTTVSAENGIVVGIESNAHGNGAIVIGRNATVTTENGIAVGIMSHTNGSNAIAFGNSVTANRANSISLGKEVHANAEDSIVIGRNSGTEGVNSLAIGSRAFTHQRDSIVIGNEVSSLAEKTITLGDHSYANAKNSVVIGMDSTTNAEDTVSIGHTSHAKGEASISFGANSVSDAKKSIALGAESLANREAGVKGETFGAMDTEGAVWTATLGALSIGENSTKTRQITGVAAGKEDTDAVNVAQLRALKEKPLTFKGDTGEDITTKLGDTVNVKGGHKDTKGKLTEENIGVVADKASNTLTVKLAESLKGLRDAQFINSDNDKVEVSGRGIVLYPNNDPKAVISLTKNGLHNGDKKITGVAAGTEMTDAVNVGQLTEAKNEFNTKLENNKIHYYSVKSKEVGDESNYLNDRAYGEESMAIGIKAIATGEKSNAIGNYAQAYGAGSMALGNETNASGEKATALGDSANASGKEAFALGIKANANGMEAVALGKAAAANGTGSMALGKEAWTSNENTVAIGTKANASQKDAAALGSGASANGEESIALGQKANTNGRRTVALGAESSASVEEAVAVGVKANASGKQAIALGNQANSHGEKAVSLGYKANASAMESTAIGSEANSSGSLSLAIGKKSSSAGKQSMALGNESNVSGEQSIGVGYKAISSGTKAIALGSEVNSSGTESLAAGYKAHATGNQTIAFGMNSLASGEKAIALGAQTLASGTDSLAIGDEAKAHTPYTIALGNKAEAKEESAIALGKEAKGHSKNAIAIGRGTEAIQENTIALGKGAKSRNTNSVVIGTEAEANERDAIVLGTSAKSHNKQTITLGKEAETTSLNAIAFGYKAKAYNENAIALGVEAVSAENGSIAIGNKANASKKNVVALGNNAVGNTENSVYLGNDSTDAPSNTSKGMDSYLTENINGKEYKFKGAVPAGIVSVGKSGEERRIQNVAAGWIHADSTDAINGSQLYATNQAIENLNSTVVSHSNLKYKGDVNQGSISLKDGILGILGDAEDSGNNNFIQTEADMTGNVRVKLTEKAKTSLGKADTAMQSWVLTANNKEDSKSTIKDGETVNFNDGKNTTVSKNGNTLSVNVNKDLVDMESISAKKEDGKTGDPTKLILTHDNLQLNHKQIKGVAEGTDGTDAVNVNQLKSVETIVNKGFNITADYKDLKDGKEVDNVSPGDTVRFTSADKNIKTTVKDNELDFSFNEEIKIGNTKKPGKVTVVGKDGNSVTLNGEDGSIGLQGKSGKATISVKNAVPGLDGTNPATRIAYTDDQGEHIVATHEDGLQFTGNNAATVNKHKMNSLVKVQGEGINEEDSAKFESASRNINVKADGNSVLEVQLAKELKGIESISNGPTKIVLGKDGNTVNMNNAKITNVADGTADSDAVNKSQLEKAKAGATTEVKSGKNISVSKSEAADGHSIYEVAVKDHVVLGDVATGIELNGTTGVANLGNKIKLDGNTGTITGLTNKEWNPETPTIVSGRAATEDQLKVLNQKVNDSANELINKGMNFAGNNYDENNAKTTIHKKLGERLDVVGGLDGKAPASSKNLRTQVTEAGKLELLMAENAEFTSVRTGDSILNNDGITIGTGDKKVSLTNTGLNNGGNKITNVADGTADSDAVNVRQMNNIQNSIVAKGLDFAGNDYDEKDESTKIHKNLGERFEVVGKLKSDMEASSDNIRTRVIKDKQQLEILMSERPVFKEVTAGTSEKTRVVIGDNGVQVGGNTYISNEGINANAKKITNVGAGDVSSTSTDAVNGAQLYAAQKAATTKVEGDKNINVGSVSNEDGSTTYKLSLNDKISLGDKISLDGKTGNAEFGKVKVDGKNGEITGLTNTTTKGEDFAKAGRAATEEQLKEVQDNVTTKIDNLSTELTDKGMNFAGNSGEAVHKKLGETLTVKGSGKKADDQYSSENIKTRVQNGELEIMLDKNLSVDTLTAKEGLDIVGKPGKDGKNTEAKISVKEGTAGVHGKDGENMERIVYKDSKNVEHTLAIHDDGMKYGGDIGETIKKQLNETVNVRGGITDTDKLSKEANIGVVSDGKDNLTIRLAKDIKDLSSITLLDPSGNKTVINGEGVTITPKDGKEVKLSSKGLDNGGNKITNIAAGTENNDVVNVGQLNEVKEVINNHATAISNNARKIEKMDGDMRRGFANAAAMSTLKFMEIGMNQATVGAAIGTYKGNQAVAVGVQTAPTENVRVHANVSIAPSREQVDTMAGIGASWRFNLK